VLVHSTSWSTVLWIIIDIIIIITYLQKLVSVTSWHDIMAKLTTPNRHKINLPWIKAGSNRSNTSQGSELIVLIEVGPWMNWSRPSNTTGFQKLAQFMNILSKRLCTIYWAKHIVTKLTCGVFVLEESACPRIFEDQFTSHFPCPRTLRPARPQNTSLSLYYEVLENSQGLHIQILETVCCVRLRCT